MVQRNEIMIEYMCSKCISLIDGIQAILERFSGGGSK